jgi:hypothetical protein
VLQAHYADHKERPFFERVTRFLCRLVPSPPHDPPAVPLSYSFRLFCGAGIAWVGYLSLVLFRSGPVVAMVWEGSPLPLTLAPRSHAPRPGEV